MAFFGKARSRSALTPPEREIVDFYVLLVPSLGVPVQEARSFAVESMANAVREATQDDSYGLPDTLGDIVLGTSEPSDLYLRQWVHSLRASLPGKRLDGMTDDDFREHWNQPDVARRMRVAVMNIPRMALYRQTLETGVYDSVEHALSTASREVLMSYGRYGSSDGFAKDDPHRPLPFEVESRVVRFQMDLLENWASSALAVERAGSLNALYRESLK